MRFNDIRGDVEILGVVCQQHLLLVKIAPHIDTEHRSAIVRLADDMFDDVRPAFTMGLPVESFILALGIKYDPQIYVHAYPFTSMPSSLNNCMYLSCSSAIL